jgi:hypothetical protein
MTELLQIALFLLALASPFLLMVWLIAARNRAQAKTAEIGKSAPPEARYATDEIEQGPDGLNYGRHRFADHETAPPDSSGGEVPGIRAIQGRH